MNLPKIVLGTVVGALFLGTTLSACAGIAVTISNDTVPLFGNQSKLWWLGMIIGVIIGIIFGGFAGSIVTALELGLLKATSFGLGYSVCLFALFLFYTGGGEWDDATEKFSIAFIVFGTINGAIVSLVNSSQNSLK